MDKLTFVDIFKMQQLGVCFHVVLVVLLLSKSKSETYAVEIANLQRAMIVPDGSCKANGCDVSCTNGDASLLYLDIKFAQSKKNVQCQEVDHLILKSYHFDDNKIPHMWTPVNFEIRKLRIQQSEIEHIKTGAFRQYELLELIFDNVGFKKLDNGILVGLTSLKSFKVIQEKPIQSIPCQMLTPIQFTLVELQFSAGLTSLDILTKCCATLDVVKNVDFSFNNLVQIGTDAFKKFPSVEDINLSHSRIFHLGHGVFSFTPKLRNLDLSYNRLSTIGSSLFKFPLFGPSANVHFWLSENPWECCCKFQFFLKHSLVHEPEKLLCRSPAKYNGLPLMEAPCQLEGRMEGVISGMNHHQSRLKTPPVSTTGRENTTQVMNATFVQKPAWNSASNKYVILRCIICNGTGCAKSDDTEYSKVRVKPKSLDFTITPLTDYSVTVGVKATIEDPVALLWFNRATREFFKMEINYKEYGLGCLRNINQTIVVDELTANVTYTFCLVHMDNPMTSPFNCMAYRPSKPYQANVDVWLSQKTKALCISLVILGILISIVFGGIVMFCIIKKKPTLLRGSKRVIMPKKSSEDIMVLPRCGSLSNEFRGVENSAFVSNRCLQLRRSSNASVDSSYVSPNLYEVIPAVKNKQKKKQERESLCL